LKNAEDLLSVSTLGFRGEAFAVDRLGFTPASRDPRSRGAIRNGSGNQWAEKIFKIEEAGLPIGTSISIRDPFFTLRPAKKFLKAETTELFSHIASLVTHYALAHHKAANRQRKLCSRVRRCGLPGTRCRSVLETNILCQ